MTVRTTQVAPVSWVRMIRAVEKVRERLLKAAKALEAAGIPYAIAGGNAVAAHVSRVDDAAVRNTRDVDILLRRTDLLAATTALAAVGFSHRHVPGGLEAFVEGEQGSLRDALHIVPAGEKIRPENVLPAPDVTLSEPADEFQIVSLPALVGMKLVSFRDKDRTHLRDLIELGLVDASWLDRLPSVLATRLRELLEHPE